MSASAQDQLRVLETLYDWQFTERGEGLCRHRIQRVPDYMLSAELHGTGTSVEACLAALATKKLIEPFGRGAVGGWCKLPNGREIRSKLSGQPPSATTLFSAYIEIKDPGAEWGFFFEPANVGEDCAMCYGLTDAGMKVVEDGRAGGGGRGNAASDADRRERVVAAVTKLGELATVKAIRVEARVSEQFCRNILHQLRDSGQYQGHARRTPKRYEKRGT